MYTWESFRNYFVDLFIYIHYLKIVGVLRNFCIGMVSAKTRTGACMQRTENGSNNVEAEYNIILLYQE